MTDKAKRFLSHSTTSLLYHITTGMLSPGAQFQLTILFSGTPSSWPVCAGEEQKSEREIEKKGFRQKYIKQATGGKEKQGGEDRPGLGVCMSWKCKRRRRRLPSHRPSKRARSIQSTDAKIINDDDVR